MCIIPRFLLQCLFDSQVGEHLFCMLLSQRIRESIILVFLDFPYWVRFAHFINLIFITLLIRSGIEILSALPKLYFNDHARPGTEWIKFTKKKMPRDRLWISLEEEEDFSFMGCFTRTQESRVRTALAFLFYRFLDSQWCSILYPTFYK